MKQQRRTFWVRLFASTADSGRRLLTVSGRFLLGGLYEEPHSRGQETVASSRISEVTKPSSSLATETTCFGS